MSTPSILNPRVSNLGIPNPRTADHDEIESRFAALTRGARRSVPAPVEFDAVFDLDYGQSAWDAEPEPAPGPLEVLATPLRAAEPAASRVRVRLTRRGRAVLTLTFLGAVMALMIPLSGLATASLTGGDPAPVRVVEVGPGDTLYGIAGELAGPGEVRTMVHDIQELNSLPGGQISEGQKLAVPVG